MIRVAVLGSTGSVGENALRVIEAAPDRFRVVGLAAGASWERLSEQASAYQPILASVCSEGSATQTCAMLEGGSIEVVSGEEGLTRVAAMPEADVVLVAVSGAAALAPALAAIDAGKTLALANKECLVMAGELLMARAREKGVAVLPVDSEHSGVFQALAGRPLSEVSRIILPASGGPFLHAGSLELEEVTPEQALAHPTWSMGKKISIDSATLMNKALEVIEARWLFGLAPDKIEVVIHPESIMHGAVEFVDGSIVAQLSKPDMRFPILHALAYPERLDLGLPRLDLGALGKMSFQTPDKSRFPALDLAYRSLEMGGTAPAVLAAADEVAVEAFLAGKIRFTRIVELIKAILELCQPAPATDLSAITEADGWARKAAKSLIESG